MGEIGSYGLRENGVNLWRCCYGLLGLLSDIWGGRIMNP
jgi:hypothetical protein